MTRMTCPSCHATTSLPDNLAAAGPQCSDCGVPLLALQLEAPTATTPQALAAAPPAGEVPAPPRPRLPMRTRRLLADAEQMRQAFGRGSLIRLQATEGEPPELYRIEYHIRGLARGPDGRPVPRDTHLVEIQLTSEYPRVSPRCRALTPIFHPNIDPSTICVGDHWAAGERLVDLVVRIGEMIAYQAYNVKSPLDGEAAMWADLNQQRLPLDGRDLRPAGDEGPAPPAGTVALLGAAANAVSVIAPPPVPAASAPSPRPSEDHTPPSADRPRANAPPPTRAPRKRGGRAVVVLMVGLIACTIWAVAALLVERGDRQAAEKARQAAEGARQGAETARAAAEKARDRAAADAKVAREDERQAKADERTALAEKGKATQSEAEARAMLAFFRGKVLAKWPNGQEGHPPSALTLRQPVDDAEPDVAKEFGARPAAEAAVRDMLGRTYAGLSEPTRAIGQYERALTLCQQVYGPNDARTLTALEDLGSAYRDAGKPAKTVELYTDLARRIATKHGTNSREALQAQNKLGVAYHTAKQFPQAIRQFEETQREMLRLLGPDDSDRLLVLTNLAVSYRDQGRPDDAHAQRLFVEAHQRYAAHFQLKDLRWLYCLRAFAETYERSGQWPKAVPLRDERLQGVLARYRPDSPQAFGARTDLATAYERAGDLRRAEGLFREQLNICEKNPGPEQLTTVTALANLGHNLLAQKKFADAEPLLRRSLTIREQKRPDSWQRYSALSLLGAALLGQKKYVDATPALLQGYEGLKKHEATIPPPARIHPADVVAWLTQLFDDVLGGKAQLGSAQELMALARVAAHERNRFADTARLFIDCLKRPPDWAGYVPDAGFFLSDHPAYFAAAAAVKAARGEGDGAGLKAEDRAKLRKQALTWMREHLTFCENQARDQGKRSRVHDHLAYAATDGWFAGVREEKQLARLPEPERKEWKQFWTDLATLREKCKPSR